MNRINPPTKSQGKTWTQAQWGAFNAQYVKEQAAADDERENTPERLRERITELERQMKVMIELVKIMGAKLGALAE